MTFEEILDQAIAMLQRRGRLTYGTLKRQFQLDDAALDDLKDELLECQRLAVDDAGRVLVWTGETDVSPTTTLPASPSAPPGPPRAPQVPAAAEATPPATPPPRDAERRQLTVMFCDLVDSTRLSSQLDPEDYRDVVRAYQNVCTEVIQRYDGHIAQLLGDGLLSTLAIPRPMKMTPNRAVRTGLGILDAMGDLNTASATSQRYPTRYPYRDSYGAGRCWGHGRSRTSGTVGTG